MGQNRFYRFILLGAIVSLFLILASCQKGVMDSPASVDQSNSGGIDGFNKGGVVQRDINDFLSTQFLVWGWFDPDAPTPQVFVSDFAGVLNNAYGLGLNPTYDGSITEKALDDGTAAVRIKLRAHNVLTYVTNANWTILFFGENASTILGGATPTVGEVNLDITFINSAPGAPIPELGYIPNVSKLFLQADAFGPLKAAAGLGPDGTPGHAWTNQRGLLTKVQGHPGIDGFAVENVKLQAVGGGTN